MQYVEHSQNRLVVPVVGSVDDKLAIILQQDANMTNIASAFKNLLNGKRKTALLGWSKMTGMPAVVSNLSSGAFLRSVISQVSSRTRRHPRTHAHSNLHCIDRLRLHSFGWQGAVPVATAPTTPIAPTAPTAPIAPAVPPAPYDHAKRRTIVPIASTRAKGLES